MSLKPDQSIKFHKFSIVIPCRNEEKYIGNCIKSIQKQMYDNNLFEIIIVDGNSEDSTLDILKDLQEKYSNIAILNNVSGKTPQALNIGVKSSSGEIIVILGAHTELDENFLKYNNIHLNNESVSVTGGTQKNVGNSFVQKLIGIVMELPFGVASAKYRWSNKEQFVDTVVYAAYRKELFDELGYFDEKYLISEDAEFNWRIRQAGHKIFFSPKIKTYYYPRESIFSFIKQIYNYGKLRVNVLKKHIDSVKFMHLVPPLFVLFIVSMIILGMFSFGTITVLLYTLAFYFIMNFILTLAKFSMYKVKYFIFIPFLIFMMHFSWGLGFLIGLVSKNEI